LSYLRIYPRRPAAAAMTLFETFHHYPPARLIYHRCRRRTPSVLVRLGKLRGLIYTSDRGQQGKPRTFVHFLETPPLLACDEEGKQLYVLGGRYRVTQRGIEG
jgi:hypothetical protein